MILFFKSLIEDDIMRYYDRLRIVEISISRIYLKYALSLFKDLFPIPIISFRNLLIYD